MQLPSIKLSGQRALINFLALQRLNRCHLGRLPRSTFGFKISSGRSCGISSGAGKVLFALTLHKSEDKTQDAHREAAARGEGGARGRVTTAECRWKGKMAYIGFGFLTGFACHHDHEQSQHAAIRSLSDFHTQRYPSKGDCKPTAVAPGRPGPPGTRWPALRLRIGAAMRSHCHRRSAAR